MQERAEEFARQEFHSSNATPSDTRLLGLLIPSTATELQSNWFKLSTIDLHLSNRGNTASPQRKCCYRSMSWSPSQTGSTSVTLGKHGHESGIGGPNFGTKHQEEESSDCLPNFYIFDFASYFSRDLKF